VTKDGSNYLMKMKQDTRHFGTLPIGKYFNFADPQKSDPFLVSCSLQPKANIAAGSGIRAM
jgi:hypothetical protein